MAAARAQAEGWPFSASITIYVHTLKPTCHASEDRTGPVSPESQCKHDIVISLHVITVGTFTANFTHRLLCSVVQTC